VRVCQFGKLHQHIGHLIAALPAADIDDNIRIDPFGQLVLNDGFAGAERPGHASRAPFGYRKKGIDDALAGQQDFVGIQPPLNRTRTANRPFLHQRQRMFSLFALHRPDLLGYGKLALGKPLQPSPHAGRHHNFMQNQRGLLHFTDNIAGLYLAAVLTGRLKVPLLIPRQAGNIAAPFDKTPLGLHQRTERPLNAVVNI